jgi:hypothetical protein
MFYSRYVFCDLWPSTNQSNISLEIPSGTQTWFAGKSSTLFSQLFLPPFIIYRGFSIATFDCQRVSPSITHSLSILHHITICLFHKNYFHLFPMINHQAVLEFWQIFLLGKSVNPYKSPSIPHCVYPPKKC